MNTLTRTTLSAFFLIAATASSMAATIAPADYKMKKVEISDQLKIAKKSCKGMDGNAKDICMEEAKGQEKIARAELEENYKPSAKGRYQVRLAKADAAYAVAKEKCDDSAGNVKDVCRKEAKSAHVAAKADAKVVEKTSEANTTSQETTTEVRKDATADKRDAEFAVAKEKCDALAGDAKTTCVNQAKTTYGQK